MQKINFQNLPNTTTPLNAQNMNAIQDNAETAIDAVDARVDELVSSKPQIATYGLSANTSMTTNTAVTIIPFDNLQSATSNSQFTLGNFTTTIGSGVGIVVPTGVTKLKVSSNVKFDNTSNITMDFVNYMWKYVNSDGSALTLSRTYSPSVASGKSTGCVAPPILVDVVAGDMIFIRAYKSSNASGSTATIGGGVSQTYITVETVE